ncbi:MAG: tRNA (N(6)-L-threonylcarbamoyladenosine(37)-C(2))-methylthiotransferase MtaB [Candidatus Gastranaerophilaceae bacterium]
MAKYILKSMGCKSNQFEGNIIEEKLIDCGFQKVQELKDADYFILNSCTVTHKSDSETLYLLRNAKHINSHIKTVLTGCLAQVDKDELIKLEYVDYIYGNDDKFNLAEHLLNNESCLVTDIMSLKTFNPQILKDTNKTRISLKIQDGCDNRCSYCIIPFARGKSRSADEKFIIEEINKYAAEGFNEVIITGIHIGQWGIDKEKKLLDLLKLMEGTSIHRYRLGSLNPTEIPLDVLEFLKSSEKFCPHFHLSLQSACDKTLRAMNRFYKTETYLEQIEYIVENFNKPFIGCDIIAGFVGETEEDFQTTVDNLKRSKLTKIHTFPYSIRSGTKAKDMAGHLPASMKEERAAIIKQISANKFSQFLELNIGDTREVLIEKRPDKKYGMLKGVTDNYLNVIIEDEPKSELFNSIHNVKIERIENGKCFGKLV